MTKNSTNKKVLRKEFEKIHPKNIQKIEKVEEIKQIERHITKEVDKINKDLKQIDKKFKTNISPIKIQKEPPAPKPRRLKVLNAIRRIIMISISLLVLLVGLDIIKSSIVSWINIDFLTQFFNTPLKSFFVSYLMTEITMSGSPIAWAFVSLGEVLNLSQQSLTAAIMGTRGGINSFLLITGILMLIRWKSLKRALGITVIQFLVTISVTTLAAVFVFGIVKLWIMETFAEYIGNSITMNSMLSSVTEFFSQAIVVQIPNGIITGIIWLLLLIGGLFLFDKSFSFIAHGDNKKFIRKIVSVSTSFIWGFIITALTLSLSVSIAMLLPLYVRKVINRKMLIAYILWANISTLFDTVFLWIISNSTTSIKVILSFLAAITIAVIIFMAIFKPYQHVISNFADKILKNKYTFIIFTAIMLLFPVILFFL